MTAPPPRKKPASAWTLQKEASVCSAQEVQGQRRPGGSGIPSGPISSISLAIFGGERGSVAKYNPIVLFLQFYFYMSRCLQGRLFLDRYVINKSSGVIQRCGVRPWMKVPFCENSRRSSPNVFRQDEDFCEVLLARINKD